MRDIKFRAYNKKNKEMIYFDLGNIYGYNGENDGVILPDGYTMLNYNSSPEEISFNDDLEIMQYTGLKDKNDIRVYDGDILEVNKYFESDYEQSSFIGKVVFEDYRWFVKNKYYCEDLWELEHNIGFKLLGNIYENKDLLERI